MLWREIDIELTAAPQTDSYSPHYRGASCTRVWNAGIEDSTRSYPYGGNGGSALLGGLQHQRGLPCVRSFEYYSSSCEVVRRWHGWCARSRMRSVKNNLRHPQGIDEDHHRTAGPRQPELGRWSVGHQRLSDLGQYDYSVFTAVNDATYRQLTKQAAESRRRLEVVAEESPQRSTAGHSPADGHRRSRHAHGAACGP